MSAARLIKYLHLAYFAKPLADRAVYRTIRNLHARNLVAIGLGDGQLARKMVLLAQQDAAEPQVRFTGIDLFEMRTERAGSLSLKQAHRMLHSLGARTRLVPGDPLAALARCANSLLETDLVVIRADQLGAAMDRAWFYLPRMLHDRSLVLVERLGGKGQAGTYEVLERQAVQQLAHAAVPMRRAA